MPLFLHFLVFLLASVLEASPTRPYAVTSCQKGIFNKYMAHHGLYRPVAPRQNPTKPHLRAGPLRAVASSDDSCPQFNSDSTRLPPIMQEIKRYMQSDDVDGYIRTAFRLASTGMSDAERERIHAQIPIYAGQYYAKVIWDYLKLAPNDHLYDLWIKRSKAVYDVDIDSTDFSRRPFQQSEDFPTITYGYDQQFLDNLISDKSMLQILEETMTLDEFFSKYVTISEKSEPQHKGPLHFLENIFSAPKPPTIFAIAKVLDMKNHHSRHEKLRHLQVEIEKVLSEGKYAMDDIIGSSTFMFLLSWRYLHDKDPTVQEFIRFLIKYGAPISERNIFRYYFHLKSLSTTTHEDLAKYKRFAKSIVKLVSGSAERSLSYMLKTQQKTSDHTFILDVIQEYRQIFPGMKFSDWQLVESLGHFVFVSFEGHNEEASNKAIDLFAEYGLKLEYVEQAYQNVLDYRFDAQQTHNMEIGIGGIFARLTYHKRPNSS